MLSFLDVRRFAMVTVTSKDITSYRYKTYFLPVVTGHYTFNLTEVIQAEPNQQFKLLYKSDIDGEKETGINQTKTEGQNL